MNSPNQEVISSHISEFPVTPKSDDSSERVGAKNGGDLRVDRNEMEFFL